MRWIFDCSASKSMYQCCGSRLAAIDLSVNTLKTFISPAADLLQPRVEQSLPIEVSSICLRCKADESIRTRSLGNDLQ